jgi:hypothetical protein
MLAECMSYSTPTYEVDIVTVTQHDTVEENYDLPVLAPNSGGQFWPPNSYGF